MSDKTQIMLPLPVVRFTVAGGYVKLAHASGLDYLLLKMVEYGKASGGAMKVADLMGLFSIAGDMLPMVLGGLDDLRSRGLLSYRMDRVTKDTAVGKIDITESGESMCQKTYAIGENGRLEERMLYFPVRNEFAKDDGFESVRDRPAEGRVDAEALTEFVLGNYKYFNLDPEAQFVSRIRPSDEKVGTYKQPVVVDYDENEARFTVGTANKVIPDTLAGLGVKAEDVISLLPPEYTELPAELPLSVQWQDSVPDIRCGHVLPRNFTLGGGLVVYDGSVVEVDAPVKAAKPEGAGYHLCVIQNRKKGRRYWFVRQKVGVAGLEGEVPVNMVLRQKMSDQEISELLAAVSSDCDSSVREWMGSLR